MTRRLTTLLVALLLTASLSGVACGDDDSASNTAGGNDSQVPAGSPQVDQQDLAFKPDKLTVSAGQTVYFKNSESAIHTVTINGKNESGSMKRGTVFAWTPPGPGTYKLTCDFHPQMHGTITVQ